HPVRGGELDEGEAGPGDKQQRPEGRERSAAAVNPDDIEGQKERDERKLPSDHRPEGRRGQMRDRPERRDGYPESAEGDRRGVEDQRECERILSSEAKQDEERARDG